MASHIFNAILHGVFAPGDRVVESKLARQLGVAQATVREALQELAYQGLVTKHDRRGTFITKLTVSDIENIYMVRGLLEPLAASLARAHMSASDIAQLTALVENMRLAGERGKFAELIKADLSFHRLIWELSGNRWMAGALNAVCPPLFGGYLIKSTVGQPYNPAADLEEHRMLLKVLQEGTPEEVREVFAKVMETFRNQEVQNFRTNTNEHPIMERELNISFTEYSL